MVQFKTWGRGLGLWLVACCLALAGGCGRLIPAPTPTTVAQQPPTATATPAPTVTRRATFTPVPATPSNTPTATVTPTPLVYVVKKGDTLLAIARQYGLTVSDVQSANGIADPRRLHIGQELIIPLLPEDREPTTVPTPTPVALRIQGLSFQRTPVGSLWCLGEVLNVSGRPAEEVQVQVTLHDEHGEQLAWGAAFVQLDIVAGGGRAPFAILFATPPERFAQYQARVLSGVPSRHLGPRYTELAVADDHGGWLDGATYQVTGQVRNTGQSDAERVAVVVTLYDEARHVVGSRTVDIAAELFLAGASAPFDVLLNPLGPVAAYDVRVQGWWVGYSVPEATATPVPSATP